MSEIITQAMLDSVRDSLDGHNDYGVRVKDVVMHSERTMTVRWERSYDWIRFYISPYLQCLPLTLIERILREAMVGIFGEGVPKDVGEWLMEPGVRMNLAEGMAKCWHTGAPVINGEWIDLPAPAKGGKSKRYKGGVLSERFRIRIADSTA